MAAVRHLGFVKFEFLMVGRLRDPFCISVPNFAKIGQTIAEISRFCDFPDGGCRHVEFSKIRNFNGLSTVGGRYASSRQITSKSVTLLQRYGDLTVLKMAVVRHLGFVKFDFLTVRAVVRPILHQRTKFRKNRSNRCRDIAIFVIFQMPAAAILNF